MRTPKGINSETLVGKYYLEDYYRLYEVQRWVRERARRKSRLKNWEI
jgi:hypothetical protein